MSHNQTVTYSVLSIDAWGNADEGWDQNDYCRIGSVTVLNDSKDADFLAELIAEGFIAEHATLKDVEFDWFGKGMGELRETVSQKPLYQFQLAANP